MCVARWLVGVCAWTLLGCYVIRILCIYIYIYREFEYCKIQAKPMHTHHPANAPPHAHINKPPTHLEQTTGNPPTKHQTTNGPPAAHRKRQTNTPTHHQTNKPTTQHTNKPTDKRANKPPYQQTNTPANQQPSKHAETQRGTPTNTPTRQHTNN